MEKKKSIVCFHGKLQNQFIFESRVHALLGPMYAEYSIRFVNAPVVLDPEKDLRAWFTSSPEQVVPLLLGDVQHDVFQGRQVHAVIGFSQGGIVAILAAILFRIPLCMCAGVPDFDVWGLCKQELVVRSKQVMWILYGDSDEIVLKESTISLGEKLQPGVVVDLEQFKGNHFFPTTKPFFHKLASYLAKVDLSVSSEQDAQQQRDEIDIVQSIYAEDVTVHHVPPPTDLERGAHFTVKISQSTCLEFRALRGYPTNRRLDFTVKSVGNSFPPQQGLGKFIEKSLEDFCKDSIQANEGGDAYGLILRAQECIESFPAFMKHAGPPALMQDESRRDDDADDLEIVNQVIEEARLVMKGFREKLNHEASNNNTTTKSEEDDHDDDERQGHWNIVIGLLGKPSAGKSTFFNAASRTELMGSDQARKQAAVGAAPFTTIDPNYSSIVFPYHNHHSSSSNVFSIPILIKDIAGLVPGAHKGRGKGNKFLNDICDASVLIHIVDGSGQANEGGDITGTVDLHRPAKDCLWILREVHFWVYENVCAKWPKKRAFGGTSTSQMSEAQALRSVSSRVIELFTGYHSTPAVVLRSARLAKLDLEYAADFSSRDKHRLVAFFIATRFPVLVCLNKFDAFEAQAQADSVRESVTQVVGDANLVVCASAEMENRILKQVYLKRDLTYEEARSSEHAHLTWLNGRTGVPDTIARAIECIKPLIVTLIVQAPSVVHTITLYRGSRVIDLFEYASRNGLLSGDFIRAEQLESLTSLTPAREPLSRDSPLKHISFIRIITNKRVHHQKKAVV